MVHPGRAIKLPRKLRFPAIVKSLTEEASTGIAQASVVDDDAKLRERVQFIHESLGTAAIVETFIEGRELYVGVVGNERLEAFPVWEMLFENMPEGVHHIATDRVKWSAKYRDKHRITSGPAKHLSEATSEELQRIAKRVFRALEMSGYARMDLRLGTEGKSFVLEANANPHIARGEDLADSAKRAGLSYADLLQRILNAGLRWKPERAG